MTPSVDQGSAILEANSPGNGTDYGSIGTSSRTVTITEHTFLGDGIYNDRLSWGSIVGRLVALAGLFFVVAQNGLQSSSSSAAPVTSHISLWHKVKLWGKIHRKAADTPYVFSQRVDHFDDWNQDTFQQVSA
jgi:hypothetical protein